MKDDFTKRASAVLGEKRIGEIREQAHVAAQIIKARHQKNWSQQGLADRIGVAKSTIGRIEAGMTSPSLDTLIRISQVLQTPIVIDGVQEGNQ